MKRKIIFILLMFVLLLGITNTVKASNPNYEIIGYNIDIEVNDNNVLNITETIKANFLENGHGIVRQIPINNKVKRKDGTTSKNYADISDIEINEQYTQKKKDGNFIIKIGNQDKTIVGEKEYIIKYSYNLGKDTVRNYDELYFNLIGTKWDTTIENIYFTIKMPKDFDETKLGFTSGKEGSEDTSGVNYEIVDNTIKGFLDKKLKAYEGFTIRLELSEGYFENTKSDYDILTYLSFIVPFLLIIITFFWWYKYGKDIDIVETVEFNPPEDLNSATIGLIYKGDVTTVEVTSLLIDLANRGYIKITQDDNEEYIFEQLKEYDGNLEEEKEFLSGLFSKTKKGNTKVRMSTIVKRFVKISDNVIKIVKDKKEKYFEAKSLNKSLIVFLFCLIIYALTTMVPIQKFIGIDWESIATIIFNIGGLAFAISGLYTSVKTSEKIVVFIVGLIPYSFSSIVFIPAIIQDKTYFLAYLVGLLSYFILALFIKIMPKRTKKGSELYGKILGFRNFLNVAEKEQLEYQVEQDPKYFYNILPYTYVLGVSDVWIKKFEKITIGTADWLVSNKKDSRYGVHLNFIGEFVNRINTSIAKENSHSSSTSVFSGGGFSGGGSGGGRTEVLGRKIK